MSSNPAKNVLLNRLSRRKIEESRKLGIDSNKYFIGVLATGRMTHSSVASALNRLRGKDVRGGVDILFHPGGVVNATDVSWTSRAMFRQYYTSPNREMESRLLRDKSFIDLIEEYEGLFSN